MNMLEKVKPLVLFLGQKKYICGSNVTYADFILFELCDFMNWLSKGMIYDKNPTLQEYFTRVKSLPGLKQFYLDDDRCIKRPYNNPVAKLNN